MNQLSTRESLEQWMSSFYRQPTPELVPGALENLIHQEILKDADSATSVQAFLAGIFRQYPHHVNQWLADILPMADVEEQELLLTALWLSDTPTSKPCLQDLADSFHSELQPLLAEYSKAAPPSLTEMPVEDPAIIDCLWASFMATGDEQYVYRVLDVIQEADSTADGLIVNVASWSVESNLKDHQKVKEIYHQYLENCPEPSQTLTDIIEKGAQ